MGIYEIAQSAVRQIGERYRRRRTLEILEGLPPELRKDIGWPEIGSRSVSRRASH